MIRVENIPDMSSTCEYMSIHVHAYYTARKADSRVARTDLPRSPFAYTILSPVDPPQQLVAVAPEQVVAGPTIHLPTE